MTPQDAIADIESFDFAIRINLASGLKHFIQLLRSEPSVKFLINVMNREMRIKAEILSRIKILSQVESDSRYEHPSDTAIAAYVWVLGIMDPENWKTAASIASTLPRGWWARKISQFISQTDTSIVAVADSQAQTVLGPTDQQFVDTAPVGSGIGNTASPKSRRILFNRPSRVMTFTIPRESAGIVRGLEQTVVVNR